MRIIRGLLDRVCFAVGVLLFMQVPHFIDQYTQRLGGFYQAQLEHLHQYQDIANNQHQGDLNKLIQEFESSHRNSVREAGANIRHLHTATESLKSEVEVLEGNNFVYKILHLVTGVHYNIASETLRIYKPGIPISVEGILCGLIGGVLLSLLFNAVMMVPKLSRKSQPQKLNKVASRIEPTVTRVKRP